MLGKENFIRLAKAMPEHLILEKLLQSLIDYTIRHDEKSRGNLSMWLMISQMKVGDQRSADEIIKKFNEVEIAMIRDNFKN